jgi:hypothetical protein
VSRHTCDWIFNTLVVLCDGKVVCGCADPEGLRPLGHLSVSGLKDIWRSEKVKRIRRDLNEGFSGFCGPCGQDLLRAHRRLQPRLLQGGLRAGGRAGRQP